MYCLSINYKRADAELRGRFAFSADEREALLCRLRDAGIHYGVVLCTCNRAELYFSADGDGFVRTAIRVFSEAAGVDTESVSEYIRIYMGSSAVRHLFRVACGIDSMIIGEDEILGQVKAAYREAADTGHTAFELNTIFQAAVSCAKRIKTETPLSRTPVSSATLAANEAAAIGEKVRALVIGASGSIGSSVLKNLLAHKNVTAAAVRSRSGGTRAFENVTYIDYADRYDYIRSADCVISATSSPHYTLTCRELKKCLDGRKKLLLIDLAVPADIEPSAGELSGVRLMDIDSFRKLAEQNNAIRRSSAEEAEEMIVCELEELENRMLFHDFLPYMEKCRTAADRLTFEELIYRMRDSLDSGSFAAALGFFKDMAGEK